MASGVIEKTPERWRELLGDQWRDYVLKITYSPEEMESGAFMSEIFSNDPLELEAYADYLNVRPLEVKE